MQLPDVALILQTGALIFYAGRLSNEVKTHGEKIGRLENEQAELFGILLPLKGQHDAMHIRQKTEGI